MIPVALIVAFVIAGLSAAYVRPVFAYDLEPSVMAHVVYGLNLILLAAVPAVALWAYIVLH